ncbi:unnamed protein product [Caenorhabditis angaria]|uniref:UPAR/Ly6 domain-containing protein n=1 Tax=Caenorhabditis angaria TaxID=860376 RepID=A0A9P1MXI2_9PELO|nr:unnamed protein product [Caenorhabditis angaria]
MGLSPRICHFLTFFQLFAGVFSMFDCFSGFVGRVQGSVGTDFLNLNDTANCAASYCIKVIIHSAIDDEGIYQQGISSRCAYTGGDRQICSKTRGTCEKIGFYDGMRGNFSFCCCQSNFCNVATRADLNEIYTKNQRTSRKNSDFRENFSKTPHFSVVFIISTILFFKL